MAKLSMRGTRILSNQRQAVLLKESFLWLNELLMTAYHS